jgi:energy-coupling factor transport system ATP-binding protein
MRGRSEIENIEGKILIKADQVKYEYFRRDDAGNVTEVVEAVKDISLHISSGEFIGIVGHNGSGKSTFAKMINALLTPSEGTILIAGMDTADENLTWDIRKNAGMVFQNPDNQIVGTMVEEDVAFGPENLGVPTDEMIVRIAQSLESVGMTAYKHMSPNHLSGGQKQRMAIAGVLAMHPRCIIFDESTAMLDPQGRHEVLEAAHMLNREQKITILFITHEMEEVIYADRVMVVHDGQLVMEETPEQLFLRGDELRQYGLTVPKITQLAMALHSSGIHIRENILTIDEFVKEVNQIMRHKRPASLQTMQDAGDNAQKTASIYNGQTEDIDSERKSASKLAASEGLILHQVCYDYSPGTVYSKQVLESVNLAIHKGEFIALIGHTGSGKSTLIQHLNGLLRPTAGQIYFEGKDIFEKGYDRTYLRGKVGLVFQYPEHQLFANTVLEDVCFGPKNLGLSLLEVQQRAFEAIKMVGLSDDVYDLSPFELSGGQKRRVAIAGVLAMKPEILILDEPVAGLDPAGRQELLDMLQKLNQHGMTILLVSHNMEDVAEYAKRVLVMEQGRIVYDDIVEKVFVQEAELKRLGLDIPSMHLLMRRLRQNGHDVDTNIFRLQEAVEELRKYMQY